MSIPVLASRRVLLAATAFAAVGSAKGQPAGDPTQLLTIMERYAVALRWNNVDALVALYTADGVFMRENLPAAVGTEALRAAYRQVFATLKVDVRFDIQQTEVSEEHGLAAGDYRRVESERWRQVPTAKNPSTISSYSGAKGGRGRSAVTSMRPNRPGTGTPQ